MGMCPYRNIKIKPLKQMRFKGAVTKKKNRKETTTFLINIKKNAIHVKISKLQTLQISIGMLRDKAHIHDFDTNVII